MKGRAIEPDEETKNLIRQRFVYDSESGKVTYRFYTPGRKTAKGNEITYTLNTKTNQYYYVNIKKRLYAVHRIAWFLFHNEWPTLDIDHIDGNGLNNAINNLRHVSRRRNALNAIKHRAGKLGGCYYNKQAKKWQAQIHYNGKTKSIGMFNTEQEAHERYLQARKEIEP